MIKIKYNKYEENGKNNRVNYRYRECKLCKKVLPNTDFPKEKKKGKIYYKWSCKSCDQKETKKNKDIKDKQISPIIVQASSIYDGILHRTTDNKKHLPKHYQESYLCELWRKDKDVFIEWFTQNYYECGEKLNVDKDLLIYDNKEYSPLTCILLPESLNKRLSNYRKHYRKSDRNPILPLGIRYDKNKKKYYGTISMHDTYTSTKLNYWDTPEEAFEEYRILKKQDLINLANEYKDKIPDKAYQALLAKEIYSY